MTTTTITMTEIRKHLGRLHVVSFERLALDASTPLPGVRLLLEMLNAVLSNAVGTLTVVESDSDTGQPLPWLSVMSQSSNAELSKVFRLLLSVVR
jgi:hypothetical protein